MRWFERLISHDNYSYCYFHRAILSFFFKYRNISVNNIEMENLLYSELWKIINSYRQIIRAYA